MLRENINNNWEFIKLPEYTYGDDNDHIACTINWEDAKEISLPHTWFEEDNPFIGLVAYKKELKPDWKSGCCYAEFEGVEQRCSIYINGQRVGEHHGSYATFRALIPQEFSGQTSLEMIVLVDNTKTNELAPMFGDFTVFGGIYRNVNLVYAGTESFDYLYYGTNGIIARCRVENGDGVVSVEPHITESVPETAIIKYEVIDPKGKSVLCTDAAASENTILRISKPELWDGKGRGACYTLKAALCCDGNILDDTEITIGFRAIKLTPDEGLFLNGRHYRLNGVAKHQDYGDSYNAVSTDKIKRDFELIEEIGANAVRLSHYQHPQTAYDICDEKGLLTWAEIPMLRLFDNEKLYESTRQQLKELILQNIHHPSIFCWGIQNEIAMFGEQSYMHEFCKKLTDLVHELDPDRCSAGANLNTVEPGSTMNDVSDIVGYNLYFGWYYGKMEDYREHLDKIHEAKPHVPFGISEYGVDTNISLHSDTPVVKDYSEEYQALFHETVYPIFEEKKYLWGSFIWNMFDFSSAIRNEGGVKGRNCKGLITIDRETKKDSFYYYKSKWSQERTLHICSKRFAKRATENITIKVYSTQARATLYVNGVEAGIADNNGNATIIWDNIRLTDGENKILVKAGELSDECIFEKVDKVPDEYKLSEEAGKTVRNWFLRNNDHGDRN